MRSHYDDERIVGVECDEWRIRIALHLFINLGDGEEIVIIASDAVVLDQSSDGIFDILPIEQLFSTRRLVVGDSIVEVP